MAEWSNAAVLKTVEGNTSGGSNPSFSAKFLKINSLSFTGFFYAVLYLTKVKSNVPKADEDLGQFITLKLTIQEGKLY